MTRPPLMSRSYCAACSFGSRENVERVAAPAAATEKNARRVSIGGL